MKNKKWIDIQNKKRHQPSDTDRLTYLQSCIERKFTPLQYQTMILPHGKFGQRRPDIIIKMYGYEIPVEHDGGVHGYNDEISETEKTKQRNMDYIRDGKIPIILNVEQLKELNISEAIFIQCATILLEPIFRAKKNLEPEKI